ncbi:MAG: type IV conjugative transfer system protein TraL [Rhodocyclaceae bacterium]|nr:type IV conjugative transfer system protein TraL [Rhodocyclaceae bacterium]MBX3669852.1 type IV conjugative transfer system protein TraL [Rhodocyclaceae bacterium]
MSRRTGVPTTLNGILLLMTYPVHRLPHCVDAPPRIAIFDADVAAIGLSGIVVAVVIKVFWVPVLSGLLFAAFYGRLKSGQHPAFLLDLAYWYFPAFASAGGRLPPGALRVFEQ